MVKLMKLMNGEEVVAQVEENGSTYKLTNPVKFMPTNKGLGMMPFLPLMEGDTVTIAADKVMLVCNVDSEVVNIYNSQFSGLVTASAADVAKILTK